MRPVISIHATQTSPTSVVLQASRLAYFGSLTMPLTGSLASGDEGVEIRLVEKGFDQWKRG